MNKEVNEGIFRNLGASNHSNGTREENDFYATDPLAMELLLKKEKFDKNIWECACGQLHLSKVLEEHGYTVRNSDLVKRIDNVEQLDFLSEENKTKWHGDIITNPPFKYAQEFVEKSLEIIDDGNKIAFFLRLQFLEGKRRKELFKKYPPKFVYVFSGRVNCAKNGDFSTYQSSAMSYAWFVWEKGYKGDTIVKWIN